jgi:hypothetical protein
MHLFRKQSPDKGKGNLLESTYEQSAADSKDNDDSCVGGSDSDDNGSSSHESGTGTSVNTAATGTVQDDMKEIKEELARHETKQVFRLRVLVMLILITAATSVSITVYYVTHSAEITEFETEFQSVSEKIIDALNGKHTILILDQ